MGFKFAMPQSKSSKADMSALAQTHARLKAWWNGEEVPMPAAIAEDTQGQSNANAPSSVPVDPGDSDPSIAHTRATLAIWGRGRAYPLHQSFEHLLIEQLGLGKNARLALLDGGAGHFGASVHEATTARIDVFDENDDRVSACQAFFKSHKQAKHMYAHRFDWRPSSLPKAKFDGAAFVFRGGIDGRVEAAAFGAERALRAGGKAIWLDFCAKDDAAELDPCRGFEQRRFQSAQEAIIAFSAAGLEVLADDDWSARFSDGFDQAWQELQENLSLRQARLIKNGGMSAGQAAIGDLMTWKARAAAVRNGDLIIRRVLAQK